MSKLTNAVITGALVASINAAASQHLSAAPPGENVFKKAEKAIKNWFYNPRHHARNPYWTGKDWPKNSVMPFDVEIYNEWNNLTPVEEYTNLKVGPDKKTILRRIRIEADKYAVFDVEKTANKWCWSYLTGVEDKPNLYIKKEGKLKKLENLTFNPAAEGYRPGDFFELYLGPENVGDRIVESVKILGWVAPPTRKVRIKEKEKEVFKKKWKKMKEDVTEEAEEIEEVEEPVKKEPKPYFIRPNEVRVFGHIPVTDDQEIASDGGVVGTNLQDDYTIGGSFRVSDIDGALKLGASYRKGEKDVFSTTGRGGEVTYSRFAVTVDGIRALEKEDNRLGGRVVFVGNIDYFVDNLGNLNQIVGGSELETETETRESVLGGGIGGLWGALDDHFYRITIGGKYIWINKKPTEGWEHTDEGKEPLAYDPSTLSWKGGGPSLGFEFKKPINRTVAFEGGADLTYVWLNTKSDAPDIEGLKSNVFAGMHLYVLDRKGNVFGRVTWDKDPRDHNIGDDTTEHKRSGVGLELGVGYSW